MSSQPSSAPVLVVGAGIVGAIVALELARHGVASLLIERSRRPSRLSWTDRVNGRSRELLSRFGLAVPRRAPTGASPEVRWARRLDEPPVLVWRRPPGSSVEPSINEDPFDVAGTVWAAVGSHPLIDLREGWTLSDARTGEDGVRVTAVDATRRSRQRIEGRFLAACDGVESTARRCLGIAMDEWGSRTNYIRVRFRTSDPRLRAHRGAALTIMAAGVGLAAYQDAWTVGMTLPADEPFSTDPVAKVRSQVGSDLDLGDVLEVEQRSFSLAVAATYRNGAAFLAGDAAHRSLSTGGNGINTAIADAVDLGWKLAATVQGWGGPELLNSYEGERRPLALADRDLCADLLEVTQRFIRLTRAGASHEQLVRVLGQQAQQFNHLGLHFGHRYPGSLVVWREPTDVPPGEWHRFTATTRPGGRPPALRLTAGTELFDHFGPGFTLVDVSGRNAGARLVERARRRGVPMTHLELDDEVVRSCWDRRLVLVRPDQHVAWRADEEPNNWDEVLDQVTGFRTP